MRTRSSSCDTSASQGETVFTEDDLRLDRTAASLECEILKMYENSQGLPLKRRMTACAAAKKTLSVAGVNSYPCCSGSNVSKPPSPPIKWPQRPIILCPSPESGMKILGIRYSSSTENLRLPGTGFCKGCTLPINNGYERPGSCLVIDFETDQFIGTAMLRVKNISVPFQSSCDGEKEILSTSKRTDIRHNKNYYFAKKKRTFQATVRGLFKQPDIPMSECITGQVFNRPAGYLPPRLIVKGAVAIISRLAPQLQARLEGDCPRFLSPLVSTAQTVLVHPRTNKESSTSLFKFLGADESIEGNIHEPQQSDQSSIMQSLISSDREGLIGISSASSGKTSVASRMRSRKRAFDKIFSDSIKRPTFDVDKEYTFEFFQHLISFDDFCLDFVKPIGKQSLHGMLNGQPLKFMAAQQTCGDNESHGEAGEEKLKWLWCFDLWHESLYEDALTSSDEKEDSFVA
ncbi:hypothetical protein HJC23_006177 [Cyclotella cryptica]|uniref:Domain of unknown function at the cortex 1 domain-containing protein n=1 Tax=Cyclotella cryptica TaxID=29204 RepID=A0ABD3Q188_9STRA|eukprot:CCRYP_009793-RA/>CCRYP_009793-RA protein AED:0.01 eAED:0.01 QI:517/-1/1/1/-1/1/1/361/458